MGRGRKKGKSEFPLLSFLRPSGIEIVTLLPPYTNQATPRGGVVRLLGVKASALGALHRARNQ